MSSEQINTKASRTVMIMAITATFASLAFGYDTGVINGALPYMAEPDQLNLTPALEGLVVSAICIGAAFGSALGGRISDILGRKPSLTYLSILFFISTLGCALSINATMIIIFRFTLGLAVGSASTIVPAYLAEIATGKIGNIGNGIISVIGTLFGFTLVRRLTRRKMLTIGLIGILFANTCIGTISNIMAGSPNLPYFVLSLTITFLFFQQTFVSPVTWVYMSEIFPLRMRGTALGIAVFFLWGSNFCIQLLFPILMNTFGLSNTFYIFSSIGILSLLFTKFIMPETKGLSIEDIERKFRHDYK